MNWLKNDKNFRRECVWIDRYHMNANPETLPVSEPITFVPEVGGSFNAEVNPSSRWMRDVLAC